MTTPSTASTSHADAARDGRRGRAVQRETFLSGRELLDRVRSILETLGDRLEQHSSARPEPHVAWLLDALDRERRRILETTLADFETTAPFAARERMSQYSAEIPESMIEPLESHSPDAFASWVAASIDRLGLIFDRVASTSDHEETAQVFAGLSDRMRGHARRIARISLEALEVVPGRDGADATAVPSDAVEAR